MNMEKIEEKIKDLPIHEYSFFKSEDVFFSEEVRILCEKMRAGCTLLPGLVLRLLERLKNVVINTVNIVFTTATKMKSSYDLQRWLDAMKEHEKIDRSSSLCFSRNFCKSPHSFYRKMFRLCELYISSCNLSFSGWMYPALESFGILVMKQS